MATQLNQQSIRNIGIYGVIREAEVDTGLIPEGAVTEAINVHFDRKGAVTLRPGITALGSTVLAGYPCWGMHNTQNGTMVVVFCNGGSARIYAETGGAYTSNLIDGTANVRIRFVNFAGKTIVLNWGTATNMYSSVQFWTNRENNAAWNPTGNPINPQNLWSNGIYPEYGEVYKNKIYIIQKDSSRLYFSSAISSAGNITWTTTTDWVDIYPDDGENGSGLRRYAVELLFFKPNYIYRFRTSSTDPDPLIRIGTRSNESIIEGKKGLYFHHETGFYKYTGGYPIEISRPISDIVDAIPLSYMDKIQSWKDNDHIYWSVGDLTIEGKSWVHVVLRYTESSEIWTVYSYANEITAGMTRNNGSTITRTVGLDNGVVGTFNSGTTDVGQPIGYRLISKWYELTNIEDRKIIQEIITICEKAQGSKLLCQVDNNPSWQDLGQLRKFMDKFENLNIQCNRIRFKLTGMSSVEGFIFRGLKIIKGINEGSV